MIIGLVGANSCGGTPVPVPNTEVKSTNGDGTIGLSYGRVARRQLYFKPAGVSLPAFLLAIPDVSVLKAFQLLPNCWFCWSPIYVTKQIIKIIGRQIRVIVRDPSVYSKRE